MRGTKISTIEKFVKDRHPELTLDPAGMGLVEPGQWILLATAADQRYLVAIDLCARPRQCVVLPINDTIAYWHARNVLAQHPAARRHASECAKELENASGRKTPQQSG